MILGDVFILACDKLGLIPWWYVVITVISLLLATILPTSK